MISVAKGKFEFEGEIIMIEGEGEQSERDIHLPYLDYHHWNDYLLPSDTGANLY